MAQRNGKGQFVKGSSGNEYGRPVREKPSHRIPAKNRKAIFNIAEIEREVTIDGEKRKLTLFEACALRMAIAGANGDRVAAGQFVDLVTSTAKEDLKMTLSTRQLLDQMNRVAEENEELRAKLRPSHGVVLNHNYDWSWAGGDKNARLDDGRTSLDGDTPS